MLKSRVAPLKSTNGPKAEPIEFTEARETGKLERWICREATHITQHCGAMYGGRPPHDEV